MSRYALHVNNGLSDSQNQVQKVKRCFGLRRDYAIIFFSGAPKLDQRSQTRATRKKRKSLRVTFEAHKTISPSESLRRLMSRPCLIRPTAKPKSIVKKNI